MAADALTMSRWQRITSFFRDSYHEVKEKTTWPDAAQVRQASIAIMVFVLIIGIIISVLDLILHSILVRLIPSLFA